MTTKILPHTSGNNQVFHAQPGDRCCHCSQSAQLCLPPAMNSFCWDCASSPNVVADPVRPPDVDPEEFEDYLAYRLAVVDGKQPQYSPDDTFRLAEVAQ